MAESKLTDIIGISLEKIKEFADSETVVGAPISVGDTTIIPVSKISMGFASGGVDYSGKNKNAKDASPKGNNFGGGGGTGVNITPIAFLVISSTGNTQILPINRNETDTSIDKIASLVERSPDILQKIKTVFIKDNHKASEENEEN